MRYQNFFRNCVIFVVLILSSFASSLAVESLLLPPLQWRCIGPYRGGRSIAVAGNKDRPFEYYFGATGGGLWKTTDGGAAWYPVTDGQIQSSSVGAVAVAESNPDIVYLGMGESQLRQNVLQGDGVYKSTDGGQTWKHIGLEETQVISRIRIHPSDPNRVYAAALGHPFGPNPERGVFRTQDGGRTWKKILYRDERTGAIDLVLDPNNPDVLYATLWEVYRKPWILWSGGKDSGIFKSTDGGENWRELTRNPGFPQGVLGKITVTVSGADSKRVYANIGAEKGGLYRSDDGGETWTLINNHRDLWQRAFYFLRIQADPIDRETIYVLSYSLLKSTDGGQTFVRLPETHGDHHDLWIDPNNPSRMINGNDGGGVVSVNGGKTWTHMRYPTAQIYRLAVTNDFPYYVCGSQQDNTTACVPSDGGYLRNPRDPSGEWMFDVGGSESGYIAPHPSNPDIFYAGATNKLTRYDRKTGFTIDIQPYPRIVMGEPAKDMPERWNWTYPIVISPIDHNVLFVGSQYLWRTTDEGKTWEKISPDLTRSDPTTLGDSGGPIVLDQDGPEIYATIYTIAPSRHDINIIWTGSDDGLIYLTRDGGRIWKDVTPPEMPKDTRVGLIEASPHQPGTAYVAARRYEMDDRAPYLWKTNDYGKSWTKIIRGIRADDFAYAICEDPKRQGLLYAGTEHGVYVSFDEGDNWQTLSMNLPDVTITGIAVKENDLVIATHGRSFWIMDNIESLRQLKPKMIIAESHLFKPADAIRRAVPAALDYFVKEPNRKVLVDILDAEGREVQTLYDGAIEKQGMHRVSWNLRYAGATVFPNIILEGGNPRRGPWAPPGRYQARLVVDGKEQKQWFNVKKDPRLTDVTDADLKTQFDLALKIRDCESAANEGVICIRNLKAQVENRLSKSDDRKLRATARNFIERISAVEQELYQVKNQSSKDKIAFPIKINDRLTGLRSNLEQGDGPPTRAYYKVFEELSAELTIHLQALKRILQENVPRLNEELERLGLSRIAANEKAGSSTSSEPQGFCR
jgi:photosystem II stability/assembly factor-like uncharacterized protein